MKKTYKSKYLSIFILSFLFSNMVNGQSDTTIGLQTEIFMHPVNSNSAYTLKKKEIIINWTPQFLPIPTWVYYGVTDRITLTVDNNIIAGLFVKPHLPVLSVNGRFKLTDHNKYKPTIAYENMIQYLYVKFDQSTNPYFATWRKGFNWYHHINMSWKITPKLYAHVSFGGTFSQYLELENKDTLNHIVKLYENKIAPDYMIGFDYRLKRISFHINYSYGTTFNYIDNVARKTEIMYGIRVAPFYKSKIKFIKCLRFEWVGFSNEFKDIDAKAYVPIFLPYFYWQWQIK
ncbi:MAG: hypothetical protein JXR68_05990 [Bacteroidales bacterium]|nr:hypothetical protein [Bacteroidales bacterium]